MRLVIGAEVSMELAAAILQRRKIDIAVLAAVHPEFLQHRFLPNQAEFPARPDGSPRRRRLARRVRTEPFRSTPPWRRSPTCPPKPPSRRRRNSWSRRRADGGQTCVARRPTPPPDADRVGSRELRTRFP